jgi:hypothetical protein
MNQAFSFGFIPPLHGFMVSWFSSTCMIWSTQEERHGNRVNGQRGQSVNITAWVKYNGDSINIANFSYWNFHARCFANLKTLQEHNITLRFTAQPIDE